MLHASVQTLGAWEIPVLFLPQNWGAGCGSGSLLLHSPASALVPPSTMSHRCVCRQGPLCLRCLTRRDRSPSTLGLSGYKYRGGVTRGSWAKAQPDTTSPSFTVTFCQMPVGRGVAYLLAYTPVTFTALARCLLAVFTLIYSSLLHPHLFPPPCYWRGDAHPTQVPLGWEGWEGAGVSLEMIRGWQHPVLPPQGAGGVTAGGPRPLAGSCGDSRVHPRSGRGWLWPRRGSQWPCAPIASSLGFWGNPGRCWGSAGARPCLPERGSHLPKAASGPGATMPAAAPASPLPPARGRVHPGEAAARCPPACMAVIPVASSL